MFAVNRSLPWSCMVPLLLSAGIAQGRDLPFEPPAPSFTTAPTGYLHLRDALPALLERQRAGGWPILPAGPLLRPGDSDRRVPLLRTPADIQ